MSLAQACGVPIWSLTMKHLFLLFIVMWANTAVHARSYVAVDLGALSWGFTAFSGKGMNINSAGQLAGAYYDTSTALSAAALFNPQTQAITLIPGVGGEGSFGTGINDAGNVIGYSFVGDRTTAFFYDGTEVKELGTLGGKSSAAMAMSSTNYVTGESDVDGERHAFLWDGSSMVDIHSSTGDLSIGRSVSSNGYVAGLMSVNGTNQAFFWDGTSMQSLTEATSSGEAVNSRGQVAGVFYSETATSSHAFFWDDGVFVDLGTLGGSFSNAQSINEQGWIAGYSTNGLGRTGAFVYRDGQMSALPGIGGVSASLSEAWYINDAGDVFGYVDGHAVKWTLVPEPASSVFMLAGLAAAGVLARRRRDLKAIRDVSVVS